MRLPRHLTQRRGVFGLAALAGALGLATLFFGATSAVLAATGSLAWNASPVRGQETAQSCSITVGEFFATLPNWEAVGKVLDECNILGENDLRLAAEYFATLPHALI